eukprot:TRINITY_DN11610_c0_g1_i1.p1 TRINITY_DN11610_c0_g1~~TRINITY_DN11610_c0_g1_i1.p1  ORF type:complete len:298 (+),score=49.83 TRINITY_DN11610_c0_g1_i1:214-1107(+)
MQVRKRGFQGPFVAPQLITFAVYTTLVTACYALLGTADLNRELWTDLIAGYSGVVGALVFFFVWIELSDPADQRLPLEPCGRHGDESLLTMEERYPLRCQYCAEAQGPRTKHCGHCNKCIHDFDHHCLYLNTCVGGGNYHLFVALVTLSVILLIGQSGMLTYILIQEGTVVGVRPFSLVIVATVSCIVGAVLTSLLLAHAYLRLFLNQTTYQFLNERKARHEARREQARAKAAAAAEADQPPSTPEHHGVTVPAVAVVPAAGPRMSGLDDVAFATSMEEVFETRASSFFGVSIPEGR